MHLKLTRMGEIKRLSPAEAFELVDQAAYTLVDVRSEQEFAAGHPTGAYNVPWAHLGPAGMQRNPDFLATMRAHFPADAALVLACKAGGRSLQAAQALAAEGYTQLVDQRAGFSGAGEPGWAACGLPVSEQPLEGRSYAELRAQAS